MSKFTIKFLWCEFMYNHQNSSWDLIWENAKIQTAERSGKLLVKVELKLKYSICNGISTHYDVFYFSDFKINTTRVLNIELATMSMIGSGQLGYGCLNILLEAGTILCSKPGMCYRINTLNIMLIKSVSQLSCMHWRVSLIKEHSHTWNLVRGFNRL